MTENLNTGTEPYDRAVTDVFGLALKTRRRNLGLRQGELADLAGVSERFVYALESGKPSVQLNKVLAVLGALGLHLELHRGAASEIKTPASDPGSR